MNKEKLNFATSLSNFDKSEQKSFGISWVTLKTKQQRLDEMQQFES